MVVAAPAITSRPTAELPVKLTMSTRGSSVRTLLASTLVGRDDIDDPRWDVGLLVDDPCQRQPGDRRQGRRLEHQRVARRQCRTELHDVEGVGEVPRRHRRHHAERLVAQQRGSCCAPGLHRRLGGFERELRGAPDHDGGTLDMDQPLVCCAAPLGLRHGVDLLTTGQQCVAELLQAACPLGRLRGRPRSRVESVAGRGDRLLDLRHARIWGRRDDLLAGGIAHVVTPAVRLDPLAVDVQAVLVNEWARFSHHFSPF